MSGDLELVVNKTFSQSGRPLLYDENIHIPLLKQVFNEQYPTIAKFCAKAEISLRTFHYWKQRYAKFKEVYEVGCAKAMMELEDLPLTNSQLNFTAWNNVMRNRFGYGKPIIPQTSTDKIKEKIRVYKEGLEGGDLELEDYVKLVNVGITESRALHEFKEGEGPLSPQEMNEQSEILIKFLMEKKGYKGVEAARMILDIVDAEKFLAEKGATVGAAQ